MKRFLGGCLAVLALVLFASVDRADEKKPKEKNKTDPPGAPLEARLIAGKDTYTLDLGGQKPEDFRKAVQEGEKSGKMPKGPAVDLTLELLNTGDKEIKIWVGGDPAVLALELKGPGVVAGSFRGAATLEFRVPETITIAAGKSHKLPLKSLNFGFRGLSNAYWTEAGEYTLTATYRTAVSPQPAGSRKADEGFGIVVAHSNPVTIKVTAK